MSKLFKLKEWLTLDEAASHISNVLGEPAAAADLYRFSLDGHLTLSVDFVNHAYVRRGKWVKTEEVEFETLENETFTVLDMDIPITIPKNYEIRVSDNNWISLDKSIVSIDGVWDITMFGGGHLDIEHYYQQLTSGLEVTLSSLDGAFVQQGDVICQLQADFDDNEFQKGSRAKEMLMENNISSNNIGEDEAKKLRSKYKEDREKYLKERKEKPREDNFYPAGGLGEQDHVLVVRTKEITRFIQSLESDAVSEKPMTSKERNSLLVLIGALCEEVKIDYKKRGVASSLVAMTEILGSPLSDDTIRKILNQIEDAVTLRNK